MCCLILLLCCSSLQPRSRRYVCESRHIIVYNSSRAMNAFYFPLLFLSGRQYFHITIRVLSLKDLPLPSKVDPSARERVWYTVSHLPVQSVLVLLVSSVRVNVNGALHHRAPLRLGSRITPLKGRIGIQIRERFVAKQRNVWYDTVP